MFFRLLTLALALLALLGANGAKISYENEKVVKIAANEAMRNALLSADVDVWDEEEGAMTIRVDAEMLLSLQSMKVQVLETVIPDLSLHLAENGHIKAKTHRNGVNEWFEEYHDYDDIVAFYNQSTLTHPHVARYAGVIGSSHGGRSIHGFILSGQATGARKLFLQANIHAREWLAPATLAYVYDSLVNGYGVDADATFILDNFQVAFIPSLNPDGYQYSWTDERLWRKNRRNPPQGSNCYGVDLNRNWDSQGYGEDHGSSSNPCSDTYHGIAAFSEPETAASSNWFNSLGAETIWGAIDFHAYGEYVLRPYGWPVTATDREADLKAIGDATADVVADVYNTRWTSQRSAQLYPAAGGTEDWMFDSTDGHCLAFCFELRGNSFIVPPEEIVLSGEEIWQGLKTWAAAIFEYNS